MNELQPLFVLMIRFLFFNQSPHSSSSNENPAEKI